MKLFMLRFLTWPLYFGTLAALVIHALWGSTKWWEGGALFVRLRSDSWPARTWWKGWGGATLGYGVMVSADANEKIVEHELVHVEQYQALTLGGLWLGLLVFAITHSPMGLVALFACWSLTVWCCYFAATLVALLRSEPNAYRGNTFEEAAYAETEVKCQTPPPSA